MRREEAWDALEQARAMDAKVRPMGRWYAVYGFGYGLMSMALLLTVGITGTVTGAFVGMGFFFVVLAVLITYSLLQPVKPLNYAKLHGWSMGLWTPIYVTAIMAGNLFFQGELLWWVPMAILSAVPSSVAGVIVLRSSGSKQ